MTTTNGTNSNHHLVKAIKAINPLNDFGITPDPVKIDFAFKNEATGKAGWPLIAHVRIDCLPPNIIEQLIHEGLKRKLSYAPGVNVAGQPNHERAASMAQALQALYDGEWTKRKPRIAGASGKLTPLQGIARRLCRDEVKAALHASEPTLYKESSDEFNARVGKAVDANALIAEHGYLERAQRELDDKAKAKESGPKFEI